MHDGFFKERSKKKVLYFLQSQLSDQIFGAYIRVYIYTYTYSYSPVEYTQSRILGDKMINIKLGMFSYVPKPSSAGVASAPVAKKGETEQKSEV